GSAGYEGAMGNVRTTITRLVWIAAALGSLPGCGSSQSETVAPRPVEAEMEASESPTETVTAPLTELSRQQVDATVDADLPVFLQKVEVAPNLVDGKFSGWRIVRFSNPAEWRGVGLSPGDVVRTINGQPIERPEQAYAVFVSLKAAKSLDVAYERDGQPMRLSLPIVDHSPPAAPSAAPPAPAPAAPTGSAAPAGTATAPAAPTGSAAPGTPAPAGSKPPAR
ncbi:MAG TPA: hypothetical protein VLC09_16855, partial [Polyangiaceae bacterium]|nr:hypothetical protein [Polyangiaceae bacterium]